MFPALQDLHEVGYLFIRNISRKLYIIRYYLTSCTMFPHLPAPIDNYNVLFLQLLLSFQSSSINFFSPISPLIPSAQLCLGLPRFLLPDGRHFITYFGNLPSSILWTCPKEVEVIYNIYICFMRNIIYIYIFVNTCIRWGSCKAETCDKHDIN
jgi:hypothetical protein